MMREHSVVLNLTEIPIEKEFALTMMRRVLISFEITEKKPFVIVVLIVTPVAIIAIIHLVCVFKKVVC